MHSDVSISLQICVFAPNFLCPPRKNVTSYVLMTIFSELHILCIELLVNGPFMHGGDFVSGMSKLCWYLDDVYTAGTDDVAGVRGRRLYNRILNHRQKILPESHRSAVRNPLRSGAHETNHYSRQQERLGTVSRHRKTGYVRPSSIIIIIIIIII